MKPFTKEEMKLAERIWTYVLQTERQRGNAVGSFEWSYQFEPTKIRYYDCARWHLSELKKAKKV